MPRANFLVLPETCKQLLEGGDLFGCAQGLGFSVVKPSDLYFSLPSNEGELNEFGSMAVGVAH